jgi:hypothetical protein
VPSLAPGSYSATLVSSGAISAAIRTVEEAAASVGGGRGRHASQERVRGALEVRAAVLPLLDQFRIERRVGVATVETAERAHDSQRCRKRLAARQTRWRLGFVPLRGGSRI